MPQLTEFFVFLPNDTLKVMACNDYDCFYRLSIKQKLTVESIVDADREQEFDNKQLQTLKNRFKKLLKT